MGVQMLSRLSAWSLLLLISFSFAQDSPPSNPEGLPEHLIDDDDDWGEVKYGFQYYKDDDDAEDQKVDAKFDAKSEVALDRTIEAFIHDGMVAADELQDHHSPEAYYQRKAQREAREAAEAALNGNSGGEVLLHHTPDLMNQVLQGQKNKASAEEQALDTTIARGFSAQDKEKAGIVADDMDMSAEELEELITLMGHFKHTVDGKPRWGYEDAGSTIQEAQSHRSESGSPNDEAETEQDDPPGTTVSQVSAPFTMGRHTGKQNGKQDAEEGDEQQEPDKEVSRGFKMGLKPGASGIVRGGATEEDAEPKTTTTTVLPDVVRAAGQRTMEEDVIAQLSAVEPGKQVASGDEVQRMQEELKDHPKVLKALQAGVSSGVVQGMNSSFSWEIVARTAEWAAENSMEQATSKAKGAIFGAAQNGAALLGLKSAGSIQERVKKMMDKEIRRNSKSQEHRVEADRIVQDAADWIAEQIVAKEILNVTDIDLGMIMKAMVLGASRAMTRCSACHDTAKATAVAAADITMDDVAKRIQQAKELQENSKDTGVLQAYMFAIIWGRNRATQMGIAEDEIDWDEVTASAKEKAEEVRKANPNAGKKDPFKAAKKVVQDYLRKHAQKGLNAFKQLAKEKAQQVKDETQL
eukprot:gnl/MRDRNA2_/MRDRNA2_28809_c0_seq1.p1 gnl/MRDRNA2_/MRDRNA2_28809_c0~~gnl/MRDRNA2_/MRDRNA2_28809_c0_seq1.p1  ORF type:complete len:636 (-),score=206.91 gnl/MRDRNA2_/MRDRNA2_28809_c0_seq1:77-1984(-)